MKNTKRKRKLFAILEQAQKEGLHVERLEDEEILKAFNGIPCSHLKYDGSREIILEWSSDRSKMNNGGAYETGATIYSFNNCKTIIINEWTSNELAGPQLVYIASKCYVDKLIKEAPPEPQYDEWGRII